MSISQWVMDELTGNRMQRGASPALHVVKGDVDTLTRETGQNSRDQKSGKAPIKLLYTLIELSGKHKTDFLKSLDWPGLQKHLEACANDAGETGPRMRRGLSIIDSEAPLRCLRIEDFGTRGLEGDDFDSTKNFSLLCRAEFKTSNEGGRGGSYGLGKAVLWRFSGIATVLLSSVVQGWESKGIRVFGRTDIPSHSIPGDREYQSSGWFGAKKKSMTDSTPYAGSVFGDDKLAKSLLLDRAFSDSSGTSALIVSFYEPDQDEVRKLDDIANDIVASAERWFWPSMAGTNPSMEVEVRVEKNGAETFRRKANAKPAWEPFIRARNGATTGTTAKSPAEIAELPFPFKIPARELPKAQAHPELSTTLKLRVTRGDEGAEKHEKANCIAVFRGAEMVVKYAPSKREPLDGQPFFGVLMAGAVIGPGEESSKAEEFFRASEPPLHNDWEYTEAVKQSYKQGAKVRLSQLWGSLMDKVFGLIDENITPRERGPELLAKLFPFGKSHKTTTKQSVKTKITNTRYHSGKWEVEGEVIRVEPDSKAWEVRIGFVAATDSGAGEYLQIDQLVTSDKKSAKLIDKGPPATVNASPAIDSFEFKAVLSPPPSLRKKDLDLTAIRFLALTSSKMASTILPYKNLGETLGVNLDLGQVPHKRSGEHSFLVDRAQAGDSINIGVEVQIPSGIKTVFPPSEHKQLPLDVLVTVVSIDGSVRQPVILKQQKPSLYTGKITLDLTRITESARLRVFAVRTKDGSSNGFARWKGSRLAWASESEIRLVERPPKGNFLRTAWEDFSDSAHVPRHFEDAMYYADPSAEPPVLYLNKMATAPLIKLLETEGHGHAKAQPRDLIFHSIAANVWLTLAQVTLEALHNEAVENGSPLDVVGFFEGSWKKEMIELLAPLLYPNLMAEDALLELGRKIEDKNFYAEALLRAQLAVQASQAIREHYEKFAERVFENG